MKCKDATKNPETFLNMYVLYLIRMFLVYIACKLAFLQFKYALLITLFEFLRTKRNVCNKFVGNNRSVGHGLESQDLKRKTMRKINKIEIID
jgi:hypothetical protein